MYVTHTVYPHEVQVYLNRFVTNGPITGRSKVEHGIKYTELHYYKFVQAINIGPQQVMLIFDVTIAEGC